MASWSQRKKLYIGNGRLAKPPNFIEDQWETAFSLCEQSTKNYTSASGLVPAKKSYIGNGQLALAEKIYIGNGCWLEV